MADLEDEILSVAQGPAQASGDSGSMRMHDLRAMIETDRYLAGRTAAALETRGVRYQKIKPPGI